VSAGIEDSATEAAVCVNVETAIHDAERAEIVVYSLYNPVANYLSEKVSRASRIDSGAVNLICYEMGVVPFAAARFSSGYCGFEPSMDLHIILQRYSNCEGLRVGKCNLYASNITPQRNTGFFPAFA